MEHHYELYVLFLLFALTFIVFALKKRVSNWVQYRARRHYTKTLQNTLFWTLILTSLHQVLGAVNFMDVEVFI